MHTAHKRDADRRLLSWKLGVGVGVGVGDGFRDEADADADGSLVGGERMAGGVADWDGEEEKR